MQSFDLCRKLVCTEFGSRALGPVGFSVGGIELSPRP